MFSVRNFSCAWRFKERMHSVSIHSVYSEYYYDQLVLSFNHEALFSHLSFWWFILLSNCLMVWGAYYSSLEVSFSLYLMSIFCIRLTNFMSFYFGILFKFFTFLDMSALSEVLINVPSGTVILLAGNFFLFRGWVYIL